MSGLIFFVRPVVESTSFQLGIGIAKRAPLLATARSVRGTSQHCSIFVHIDTDAEALSISDKHEQRSAECWSVKFIEPAGFGPAWTNSESEHILNLKVTGLTAVMI